MTKPQLDQLCPPIALTSSAVDRESLNYRALEAMNTNASLIGGMVLGPGRGSGFSRRGAGGGCRRGGRACGFRRLRHASPPGPPPGPPRKLLLTLPSTRLSSGFEGALSRADWEAVRSKRL
ncbi:MAG: hypothetical protein IPL58_14820 [Betaproteobacteria bacterium]|uniref:Uncharacterized protein n=1 Tax=Candidatus Proximibacter danicus TaxID=2954365 RepID=A0A9D7K5V5_9PROT|nr:hypothetical protein [Candidatus Proximibacter danicus]